MAAEQHFCERHHRPAVTSRVRILPDGSRETEYLCEIDLAEERMSGAFGRRSLFDDFFSDFAGGIQRMVENELSRLVLGGKVDPGDRVRVDALEGELHFDVQPGGAAESREGAAQPEAVGS